MTAGDWARAGLTIARTFGARGLAHRVKFEARRRLHRLKDTPSPISDSVRHAVVPPTSPFRPNVHQVRAMTDRAMALERAERVRAGDYQRYRWTWVKRPASAAEWLRHPESGYCHSSEIPWYHVRHIDDRAGDIKDLWDPARFGWAVDLARGWLLTGDEAYPASFAQGVEQFLDAAAPFRGVHWSCGQETAIRALTWLWCEPVFDDAKSFTPRSRQRLREALAWSAERIDDAIDYAISQHNNHGLSEATGLIAVGVRLTGADPRARRWIARGAAYINRLVRDQFAPDGWYIQHSFTYTRLALDQLVVARRALRHVGRDLAADCVERIGASIRLLAQCADPESGEMPNHGANDGSFVLPLTTRPYIDFRPSLTAAAATFGVALPAEMPVDREILAWLSETEPEQLPSPPTPRVYVGGSGWALAKTSSARVFARAARYRSRPGHIDPGHVDIWLRGAKQAVDAGTFRYLAAPPWRNALVHIDVHNTLSIDGLPAAVRGPRFLWLSWPDARIVAAEVQGTDDVRIVIENYSWRRAGVIHRRTCNVRSACVVVVDEIEAPASFRRRIRVQWLLDDGAAVSMWSAGEARLIQELGPESSTFGWISEGYGDRRAVRSIRLETETRRGRVRVISAFGDVAPGLELSIRDETMITCAS